MDKKDILHLLTTGLHDIPSVIQKLSDRVAHPPADVKEDFIWSLWHGVFWAAGQATTDKQINRLVDFLVQLSKVEVKDPATGKVLEHYDDKVWTGLPIFWMEVREWYNFNENEVKGEELDYIERQVRMLSLFMAADQSGENSDSMYPLWGLREAFEQNDTITSSAVRLTAPWILNTGKLVWQQVEREVRLPDRCGIPGEKYRDDKRWRGYNKERWAVWRNGFLKAQAEVEEEEVKELAGRVAEKMKELEG